MLGAIAGDVIGSVHEHRGTKSTRFPLFDPQCAFTDDTVLTVATAYAILTGTAYETAYRQFGRRYPAAGYGGMFLQWLDADEPAPYGSWGNGSAMRVAPVGLAFDDLDRVLQEAEASASVTHDHPEGIRGAQAVAMAVFLARSGAPKEEVRKRVARWSGYDLGRTVSAIRPAYRFDVSCRGSVPEALIAFLDSNDVEDAIRLAVSLGGDCDTQAAIAGGVAHACYGAVPDSIREGVRVRVPEELLVVIEELEHRYPVRR